MSKDQQPAFPCHDIPDSKGFAPIKKEITLRQWYAGQALTSGRTMQGAKVISADDLAKNMFEIADAMIAFEEKEGMAKELMERIMELEGK